MKDEKLKPCPKCGGKAKVMAAYCGPFAYCVECHAHRCQPLNDTVEDAIKQWNKWNGIKDFSDR